MKCKVASSRSKNDVHGLREEGRVSPLVGGTLTGTCQFQSLVGEVFFRPPPRHQMRENSSMLLPLVCSFSPGFWNVNSIGREIAVFQWRLMDGIFLCPLSLPSCHEHARLILCWWASCSIPDLDWSLFQSALVQWRRRPAPF